MAKSSKYFSESELSCHCCGTFPENEMDQNLLDLLDSIREAVGGPLSLSCAYRCPEHNARTPGAASNSNHMYGVAADIICPDNLTVDELYEIAKNCGATGLGRYYSMGFVHVDKRSEPYEWIVG